MFFLWKLSLTAFLKGLDGLVNDFMANVGVGVFLDRTFPRNNYVFVGDFCIIMRWCPAWDFPIRDSLLDKTKSFIRFDANFQEDYSTQVLR